MSRTFSGIRAVIAASVLALGIGGAAKAQDPFGSFRYEPYAVYSAYNALQTGLTVVTTENSSITAQTAYNYSSLAWQYEQYLYYTLYPNSASGGSTSTNYASFSSTVRDVASKANQAAYQAYLEMPTSTSQAFSGWQYYTYIYSEGFVSQGPPTRNTTATASQIAGYYVRARLYGFHLPFANSFLTHNTQLDLAAQHHAAYMAGADAVTTTEGVVTTNAIITTNSTYLLDTTVPVLVLNTQASNVGFISAQFGAIVATVGLTSTDIGVGVATSGTGKVYYTVYVAKHL